MLIPLKRPRGFATIWINTNHIVTILDCTEAPDKERIQIRLIGDVYHMSEESPASFLARAGRFVGCNDRIPVRLE